LEKNMRSKISLLAMAVLSSSAFAQNYVNADLVSSAGFNLPAAEQGSYYGPDLDASLDGRYITFKTFTSLAPGHNGGAHQYLKDMNSGQVTLIPNSLYAGPFRMDNNGDVIAFTSSSNLYLYVKAFGTSNLILTNINTAPEISPNGRFVVVGRYDNARAKQTILLYDFHNKTTTSFDVPGSTVNAIDYLSVSDVIIPIEKGISNRTLPRFAFRVSSGSNRIIYIWDELYGFQALPNGGANPWPDSEPVLSGNGLQLFFSRRTEVQCAPNQTFQTTREIYSVAVHTVWTAPQLHTNCGSGLTSHIAAMPRPSYSGDKVTYYGRGFGPGFQTQDYFTVPTNSAPQIGAGISVRIPAPNFGIAFDNNYSGQTDQSNTLTPTNAGYVIAPIKSLSNLDPNTAGDRTDYYRSVGFSATVCGEKLCHN
jgi:hypothetical protein